MRWLLFISLLFPTVSHAQIDTLQLVEIGGFYAKNLDSNNPKKIILSSSSNVHIFSGSTDEETKQDTLQLKNRKSPITAFVLSLVGGATIVPALGQHYNGEHNKGLLMGAGWLVGMAILFPTEGTEHEKTGQIIGFPLVYTAFIWSCIDAPISAKRINKRLQQQNTYGHLLEFNHTHYVWGIDLIIAGNFIDTKLSFHF